MPQSAPARWSDGFDGDELGVFRLKDRDCDPDQGGCGRNGWSGEPPRVVRGWRRGSDTHRRLVCPCGRAWWQVDVGSS